MKATFQSADYAPRSVRVVFRGERTVHFTALKECGILVHYFSQNDEVRRASVATDEVSKDARRAASVLYFVYEDTAESFSTNVDAIDPAMTTIREILTLAKPEEKAKELLAAAYTAESWPKEFKDTLKAWMQADDEAESEVPVGAPDEDYDSLPKTAPLEWSQPEEATFGARVDR